MKKLIAIAVMIALVVGAAFAETSVSGTLDIRLTVVDVASTDGVDPTMHGQNNNEAEIILTTQNDESTYGGMLRIRPWKGAGAAPERFFAWWKPIDELKIWLGVEGDGQFETGQLTSWAYNQGGEGYITTHDWGFWRGVFPGNWDDFGLAFSIYAVENLEMNLAVHVASVTAYDGVTQTELNGGFPIEEIIGHLQFNANYAIPDVGKILFDWTGPQASFDAKNYGMIGASFYMDGLVEDIKAQLGFSKNLTDADSPINLGLALAYDAGEWGVKFRSAFILSGTGPKTYAKDTTLIVAEVMPWYDMGNMKFNFNLGMAMRSDNDTTLGWFVNPYLKVPAGAGFFQIGVKLFSGGKYMSNDGVYNPIADDDTYFVIPMRFVVSF